MEIEEVGVDDFVYGPRADLVSTFAAYVLSRPVVSCRVMLCSVIMSLMLAVDASSSL